MSSDQTPGGRKSLLFPRAGPAICKGRWLAVGVLASLQIFCVPPTDGIGARPTPLSASEAGIQQKAVPPSPDVRRSPTVSPVAGSGESIEVAQSEMDQALRSGDWNALVGRFAADVVLVDGFSARSVQPVTGKEAWRWLQERWQPGTAVVGVDEVIHYGLLQLETGPWLVLPPGGRTLYLNAHRYDESGQQDAFGRWLIDAILYSEKD